MKDIPARRRGVRHWPTGPGLLFLAGLAVLQLGVPGRSAGSTAIVPDNYSTIQLGLDSRADTILVRAGTYAESPRMVPNYDHGTVVLMADPAASPRPTLQGLNLWISHDLYDGNLKVVGLRILSQVDITSHTVSARYDFEACRFEAGLGHILYEPEYSHAGLSTTFVRCTIVGSTDLIVGTFLTMESDTIEGGGASFRTGGAVRVSNCWFRNASTGLRIHQVESYLDVDIAANVFEGCWIGLSVGGRDGSGDVRIRNNTVFNCRDWGIRIEYAEYVNVLGNDVRQCGGGISAQHIDGTPSRVNGNTVIGAGATGISLRSAYSPVEVRNNVVLRCGGTGIVFVSSDGAPSHHLTGNTSALNGGSGYELAFGPTYAVPDIDVSNNIAYGNTGWGLRWTGEETDTPTLGCNDWFANAAGAVSGTTPGATDLLVDPLFCDLANDDGSLRSDSPLVGGACGTIGAKGIGCDTATEVLVVLFSAETSDRGVGIRWRLGGDARPVNVWIERSDSEPGPWQSVETERLMDADITVDWDRTTEPGRRYWYRLAWTTNDRQQSFSSAIAVDLSTLSAFALRLAGPNPASGPVAVEYALPRDAAIELTIHDLLGREVTRLASGVQTTGVHVTRWMGAMRGGRARPGVYFVRLAYAEGRLVRRIVLHD